MASFIQLQNSVVTMRTAAHKVLKYYQGLHRGCLSIPAEHIKSTLQCLWNAEYLQLKNIIIALLESP